MLLMGDVFAFFAKILTKYAVIFFFIRKFFLSYAKSRFTKFPHRSLLFLNLANPTQKLKTEPYL